MDADNFERVEITSAVALWEWLERNASRRNCLWLITHKREQRQSYVSREEVLDALIAHGWVDGRRVALDDTRTMQLIGPRQQKAWSESYCTRAERLMAEGRMRPLGEAAVQAAKETGMWRALPEVDGLQVPEDLVKALAIVGGARAIWDAAAPSYRRNLLRWIANARKSDTRARRIAVVVDSTANNERLHHF